MKTFIYGTLLAGFVALSSILGGTWGCSSGGGGGGGGSGTTNLGGTIALNDGSVGTLNVTIQSTVASSQSWFSIIREAEAQASTVPATGNCISPTCTINNLSGTYTPSTGAIDISGGGTGTGCGGSTTTFVGTVSTGGTGSSGGGGGMTGTIQDSSGSSIGGFSGVFTTDNSGGGSTSYCGIAVADNQDAFNVTIAADGSLAGSAQPIIANSNDKGATFVGKATGSTFQACSTNNTTSEPICGTIGADGSINGKFVRNDPGGGEGCFVGSTSVCTTGTLPQPCSGPTVVCTYPTCP